jgi:hypothetical protein
MPVSRKRKKSRPSKPAPRTLNRGAQVHGRTTVTPVVTEAFASLLAGRDQMMQRRAARAAEAGEALVAELVEIAATVESDTALEDELCARFGACLADLDRGKDDEHVAPDMCGEALSAAAVAAVRAALVGDAADQTSWRAPWRVLGAVATIVPISERWSAVGAINELRRLPGGRVLPAAPDAPPATDRVLWTRDAYGSRFAVAAAFPAPEGPARWYLWDIDACGYQVFAVHSGYYATPELALAAWQAEVGPVASEWTKFGPVDDPALLAELLPTDEGLIRAGGEHLHQFVEYHRSRSLAQAAVTAVGRGRDVVQGLEPGVAAAEFATWLRDRRGDQSLPDGPDELITELADSWRIGGPEVLYPTCSPHRVALTVLHLRDYYQDDFAADLVALLPDWTSWLAERNCTTPDLAERCRPYALGEPYPGLKSDDTGTDYQLRLAE